MLAQFPGYGNKWYHAEIYSKYRGKFHLYYLEDGSIQKNVEKDKFKPAGAQSWTKKSRSDYLNETFERPGEKGKWKAIQVGKGHRINKYGCKSVEKPTEKLVWIAVSDVQKFIKKQCSS